MGGSTKTLQSLVPRWCGRLVSVLRMPERITNTNETQESYFPAVMFVTSMTSKIKSSPKEADEDESIMFKFNFSR
jgi:hypothetical protein